MKIIKIYIKRDKLEEKRIIIPLELEKLYELKFLLQNELKRINNKLYVMQKNGIFKNIKKPQKGIADDLIKSRKSIKNGLKELTKV